MTPEEAPDWTVVEIIRGTVIVKENGWWSYLDTGGSVPQQNVLDWYEAGSWKILSLPLDYHQDPWFRPLDPWDEADEHEFMRFGAGSDYRHICAYCRHPRRHPIHGLEHGLDREPVRSPIHNDPPAVSSVKGCYAALIDTLDEYNESMPEGDRVMIPFTLQEVIAGYIEEREAIESIWRQQQEDNTHVPGENA